MPAVLALLASVGYGAGSALSRTAVRHHTAAAAALWVQIVGLLALVIAAGWVRPSLAGEAVAWGGAAGMLAAFGVLAFYTAMQNGPISLVAPISAGGVAIPVVGGLLLGERMNGVALTGLLFVVTGVMVIARSHSRSTTADPHATDGGIDTIASPPGRSQVAPVHDNCKPSSFMNPRRAAIVLALVSSVSFGVFYLVLREAAASTVSGGGTSNGGMSTQDAILVALAVQAGSLMVTLVTASRHTIRCVRPDQHLVGYAVAIGLLDVGGDVALTYAIAAGANGARRTTGLAQPNRRGVVGERVHGRNAHAEAGSRLARVRVGHCDGRGVTTARMEGSWTCE